MYSEAEARIRRLASRLKDAEFRMDTVGDRILRTAQNLAGFNQVGVDFGRCTTTFTGKVVGGDAALAPLPGASIRIVGVGTGTDYGTYFLPTGSYSIGLTLENADTSFSVYAIGPTGTRFNSSVAGPFARTLSTRCTTNAWGSIQCDPAVGYRYIGTSSPASCQYPLKQANMNWEDSLGFSGTAGWVNVGSYDEWRTASHTRPWYSIAPCFSTGSQPTQLTLRSADLLITHSYSSTFVNRCPQYPGSPNFDAYPFGLVSSKTCPTDSVKFDCTWTLPGGTFFFYGPNTEWIRFWEP